MRKGELGGGSLWICGEVACRDATDTDRERRGRECAASARWVRRSRAGAGDADQLGRLYFDCQVPGADLADVIEGIDEVRAFFLGEFGEFWPAASGVVEIGGQMLAALLAVRRTPWDDAPDCPFITDLFAKPEYRRYGLARVLMERCLIEASASSRPKVALRVDSDNTPALRLYESLGFRSRQDDSPARAG